MQTHCIWAWMTRSVLFGLICFIGSNLYGDSDSDFPPGFSTRDDVLDRWMANCLGIKDIECRIARYSNYMNPRDQAELLKAKPTKDSR